jgi:hypothetical protein
MPGNPWRCEGSSGASAVDPLLDVSSRERTVVHDRAVVLGRRHDELRQRGDGARDAHETTAPDDVAEQRGSSEGEIELLADDVVRPLAIRRRDRSDTEDALSDAHAAELHGIGRDDVASTQGYFGRPAADVHDHGVTRVGREVAGCPEQHQFGLLGPVDDGHLGAGHRGAARYKVAGVRRIAGGRCRDQSPTVAVEFVHDQSVLLESS